MFGGCFGGVPGCSGDVPGMFQGCSRVFRRVFRGVFRGVPGCSGCLQTPPNSCNI